MNKSYYALKIQYSGTNMYIWIGSEENDSFLLNGSSLAKFETADALYAFCADHHISLMNQETVFIIPPKERVLALSKDKSKVNAFCKVFLNLWNLALDINCTFGKSNPYLDGSRKLYDKIFYGNNLLLDESETQYVPSFNKREQQQIGDVLKQIYDVFENYL